MNFKRYNYFSKQQFVGKGGYFEISRIAYPLIIMGASNIAMMFADRLFLAHAGTDLVTAALPVGILYFTLFCFFSGTVNFTSALVAQLFGAKNNLECVRAAWSGFYIGLAASLIIIFVNIPLAEFIILKSGMQQQLITPAFDYLHGLRFNGVFTCLALPLFGFYSGRGITWPIAVISTCGCLLNIILDYLLIFGKFGAPEMGIYGGGLATTISSAFSFVCAAGFFLFVNQREYPTRKKFGFRFEFIKKIFRFGAPGGLQIMADVGSFAFMSFLVASMSVEAGAATTIALSINNLSFTPLLGLSDSTTIISGQYIGRGRPEIAEKTVYRAWRMSLLYMGICSIIYLTCPEILANLFRPESAGQEDFSKVIEFCVVIMAYAAVFNMFDSIKFIFMAGLRGAGDTIVVFFMTTGSQWLIMVPGLYILVKKLDGTVTQLWMFMTLYFAFEGLLIFLRFKSGRWKKIKLINHSTLAPPL